MTRPRVIAVIGAGSCDAATAQQAEAVGRLLGAAGCTVVTGGLGGVMEAASRGAREAGALVVGVVPGADPEDANEFVEVSIASGMGDARNCILANTAEAFVAVGGSFGTLSEIAFARKRNKPVAVLGSWSIVEGVYRATTPEDAVAHVLR